MRAPIIVLVAAIGLAASIAVGIVIAKRLRTGSWAPPTGDDLVKVADAARGTWGVRRPPKVIYLHRTGIELRGGRDASHEGKSSIVGHDATVVRVPAFSGGDKKWRQISRCVQDLFAPFDVEVVDQRPVQPGYILVAVGGRSELLGGASHGHAAVGGLAPFNGKVIHDAVVFAFSSTLRNRPKDVCETIGMEVAHAYGLDHGYECRDIMTYRRGCKRRFVDKDVPCGENKPRACHGGAQTQNSYRYLLDLLGPRA